MPSTSGTEPVGAVAKRRVADGSIDAQDAERPVADAQPHERGAWD